MWLVEEVASVDRKYADLMDRVCKLELGQGRAGKLLSKVVQLGEEHERAIAVISRRLWMLEGRGKEGSG